MKSKDNIPFTFLPNDPTFIQENITRLRFCMTKAGESEFYFQEGKKILKILKGAKEKKEEIEAYHAAFIALQAKHTPWPLEKWNAVNKALPILLQLSQQNPHNIEILFVKNAVMSRLPAFFQKTQEVLADTEKLIQLLEVQWESLEQNLRSVIVDFLLTSSLLKPSQKRRVQSLVAHCYFNFNEMKT